MFWQGIFIDMNHIFGLALVGGNITAVPSAPQGISVSSRSANFLTISWQNPMLIHPTDRLSYK